MRPASNISVLLLLLHLSSGTETRNPPEDSMMASLEDSAWKRVENAPQRPNITPLVPEATKPAALVSSSEPTTTLNTSASGTVMTTDGENFTAITTFTHFLPSTTETSFIIPEIVPSSSRLVLQFPSKSTEPPGTQMTELERSSTIVITTSTVLSTSSVSSTSTSTTPTTATAGATTTRVLNVSENRLPTRPVPHRPWVATEHSPNVTTFLGRTASLRCRLHNRRNYTVSWIRHRDLHLLTVDRYTYTSDQRFQAIHESSTGDWVLIISSLQRRDAGSYECQISTTPPLGHFIYLNIVEPETRLLGGSDLHINLGSTLNLTCLVLYHPRPPDVTWLHEGKSVGYTSARGGVSVVTESGEATRSSLLIQRAAKEDSGNYTCQPVGGQPATTSVHVLSGELRAAMQGSASNTTRRRWHMVMASLLLQVTFCSLVTVSLLATPKRAGTRGRDGATVMPTTHCLKDGPHTKLSGINFVPGHRWTLRC